MDVTLHNLNTQARLEQHLVTHGCYSEAENRRIYRKWFAAAPRYLFRAVDARYQLTQHSLCDVGCAYGGNLAYCTPDSYGIEIENYEVAFAQSVGLTVHHMDVITADFSDLPQVDAVWNSATLEHVEAPHIFIRKLHMLLKPDGLLALYVPTLSPFKGLGRLPRVGRYFTAYRHGDHINAFTPSTLRFFCERAGFKTVEVSPFYPGVLGWFNRFPWIDGCVYIGRKIEHWDYPANATRRAQTNIKGFTFKGQTFGETPQS